jgi:hypothetical protein
MDVTEDSDLDSDHSPIVLTVSEIIIIKDRNPTFEQSNILGLEWLPGTLAGGG